MWPISTSLASLGFGEVSLASRKALLVCSQALEKKGKTHFALTAPGPIALISTDTGSEETAAKFKKVGKVIHLLKSTPPKEIGTNVAAAITEWDKLLKAWYGVISDKSIRTMIVDTHTEFWQVMRLARFGKLEQVPPKKYDEVNKDMRDMIKAIKERQNLNAVFIHKVKKTYVGSRKPDGTAGMDSWNGEYERAGFGDMGYLCDVVVENNFSPPDEPGKRALRRPSGTRADGTSWQVEEKDFYIRILDTRYEMQDLIGQCFAGEECDFFNLVMAALPDADFDNWL